MRIVLIDFYDSYTNNIPGLVKQSVPEDWHVEVTTIRHDIEPVDEALVFVQSFDGIILSPGPGTPNQKKDIGELVRRIWKIEPPLPILGICLGFQVLCCEFGGSVQQMCVPKHGIASPIYHRQEDIYCSSPMELIGTRYHSLKVEWPSDAPLKLLSWTDDEMGQCAMGVKHSSKPFWGVQYHPESVVSVGSDKLMLEFLSFVRSSLPDSCEVVCQSLNRSLSGAEACDILGISHTEMVMLESVTKGEWTYLSSMNFPGGLSVQFSLVDMVLHLGGSSFLCESLDDVWDKLSNVLSKKNYLNAPDIPFVGGLLGFVSYELGLRQLDIEATGGEDLSFLWCTNSISLNHSTGQIWIVSLDRNADWVERTALKLSAIEPELKPLPLLSVPEIVHPSKSDYLGLIDDAIVEMRAGNSYEVCLTAQTQVIYHCAQDPWQMYQSLRKHNPAPFSAFIHIGNSFVLSSSPERFMQFNKRTRTAQMKPIKGTMKKEPGVSFEDVKSELLNAKNFAENLMIVDLIRHDLALLSDTVECREIMSIEEHESLYQLVSTINGKIKAQYNAVHVLRSVLPPGSMTGAPKKRTCQILQRLEKKNRRGIYSGVIGFLSVNGNADFNVVIRTIATQDPNCKQWAIGAGGAVLVASDVESEWEERQAKSYSVIGALQPHFSILETIRYSDGELYQWDAHWARLASAANHFRGQKLSEDLKQKCKVDCLAASSHTDSPQVRIRLLLNCNSFEPLIESFPLLPSPAVSFRRCIIYLDSQSTNTDYYHDFIRYKTTYRPHYEAARARFNITDADHEVLLHNDKGNVTEGSITNVAFHRDGKWITPKDDCLPGIEREHLLFNGHVHLGSIKVSSLQQGEDIMLFNSLKLVWKAVLVLEPRA